MNKLLLAAALTLLAGTASSCIDETDVTDAITGKGTIQKGVGPECPDTWYIAASDGRQYWPVEDPAFQKPGLKVRFVLRERRDAVSICMAGTIVDVISIRED